MPFKEKEYQQKYHKKWYEANKQRVLDGNKRRTKLVRKRYFEYLQNLVCEICGEKDWRCLEFDHSDTETKKGNVSDIVKNYGWNTVKKEIDKCRVLCANCHRKHTFEQLGWYKDLLGD